MGKEVSFSSVKGRDMKEDKGEKSGRDKERDSGKEIDIGIETQRGGQGV